MKKLALSLIIILLSGSAFSQIKPDTLIIETPKKQKIILISDDINNFRHVNSDSLINAALRKVKDSLQAPRRPSWNYVNALSKEERYKYLSLMADSMRRVNDSLHLIDGLTTKERYKINKELEYSDKSLYSKNLKGNFPFGLKYNAGGGTIRSTFSSVIEAGIVFQPDKQWYYSYKSFPSYAFMALTVSRYYTFEQIANSFKTHNNTFINLSLGSRQETKRSPHAFVSEYDFGVGYLAEREGPYFGNNTFKLFGSVVTRYKFLRLTPEIYITDNFKESFPGFSIKFF